jgi:MOSC domain-containing protein YiiM
LPELAGQLLALSVGRVATIPNGSRAIKTAYVKHPVDGPLHLGVLGFPGDEHVYAAHGGVDKAVCVYPIEHYEYWSTRLGLSLPDSAAFGENFTVSGLLETDVCLGDILTVGQALVQVTEPRAPCFKIAARYGVKQMAVYVQREGYTGYLMRVLREGNVEAGARLELTERRGDAVSVAETNRILNIDKADLDGARRVLAWPALPPGLRRQLQRRLSGA